MDKDIDSEDYVLRSGVGGPMIGIEISLPGSSGSAGNAMASPELPVGQDLLFLSVDNL